MDAEYSQSVYINKNEDNLNKNNRNLIENSLRANYFQSQMVFNNIKLKRNKIYILPENFSKEKKELVDFLSEHFEKISKNNSLPLMDIKLDDTIEDNPLEEQECKICLVFKNSYPVLCKECKTIFCIKCSEFLKNNKKNCPYCMKIFEEVKIDPTLKRIYDRSKFCCPNESVCCLKVRFENLNKHINEECLKVVYDFNCEHCKETKACSFDSIEILVDHVNMCMEIEVSCEYCRKQILRKDLEFHNEICEFRKVKCEDCEFEYCYNILKNQHDKAQCMKNLRSKYQEEMRGWEIKNKDEELVLREKLAASYIENEKLEEEIKIKDHQISNFEFEKNQLNSDILNYIKANEKNEETFRSEFDKLNEIIESLKKSQIAYENNSDYLNKENCILKNDKISLEEKIIMLEKQINELTDIKNNIPDITCPKIIKKIIENLKENNKEISLIDTKENRIYYKNGLIYEGNIENNQENGKGQLFELKWYKIFDGYFKNGKREGKGKQYHPEFIYEGEFSNDKREGNGVFIRINTVENFEKYDGFWESNRKNGIGKQYDDIRLIYEGNFKDDLYHGEGILYNEDGRYEGEFANNKRHGEGKYFYLSGKFKDYIYEGKWLDDKKYGEYSLYDGNHKLIQEGIYKN